MPLQSKHLGMVTETQHNNFMIFNPCGLNILPPEQNDLNVADNNLKCMFWNENLRNLSKILLKHFPHSLIDEK